MAPRSRSRSLLRPVATARRAVPCRDAAATNGQPRGQVETNLIAARVKSVLITSEVEPVGVFTS